MTIYMQDGNDTIHENAHVGTHASVFDDEVVIELTGPVPMRLGLEREEVLNLINRLTAGLSLLGR